MNTPTTPHFMSALCTPLTEADELHDEGLGEGWFPTIDDVPGQAISMSVRQILKSQHIVCTVPDERKAKAVRGAIEGPLTNILPGLHPAKSREYHDLSRFQGGVFDVAIHY